MSAQSVNLAGVWQADLQQSTIPGPPLKGYLEVIQQSGVQVTELIGSTGSHGQERAKLSFTTDGKPTIAPYRGVPCRTTATAEGQALSLNVETSGRPETTHRKYELSGDGQKLTLTVDASMNGKPMHAVYILAKQPESAASSLLQPEAPASEHFKNLKTDLKTLPASEFIDNMRYFAWSLNKECNFCHVQGHFDSDEKEEKRTARVMLRMVADVNKNTFDGKQKVNCYTCHEFREHPQARPLFEGEPEHQHQEDNERQAMPAQPSH